tara:strand:+ start:4806 stop:5420 length:615 start_codon:yes stop_codon:yes gene_type:complete
MSEDLESSVENEQNSGMCLTGKVIFIGIGVLGALLLGKSLLKSRSDVYKGVEKLNKANIMEVEKPMEVEAGAFEKPRIYKTDGEVDIFTNEFHYSFGGGFKEYLKLFGKEVSITYIERNGDGLVDAMHLFLNPIGGAKGIDLNYSRRDQPNLAKIGDKLLAEKRTEYAQHLQHLPQFKLLTKKEYTSGLKHLSQFKKISTKTGK